MSFSLEVKEELSKHIGSSRHCRLAEIAAIIDGAGYIRKAENGEITLYLQDDNTLVVRKFFTLLKKAFNIGTSILEGVPNIKENGRIYRPVVTDQKAIHSVLGAIRMIDQDSNIRDISDGISRQVTRNSCCKRAFLAKKFLLELARYTNEQNEDTDAVTMIQDYADAIGQSLRHTYD